MVTRAGAPSRVMWLLAACGWHTPAPAGSVGPHAGVAWLETQAGQSFANLPPAVAQPNRSATVLLCQAALRKKKLCGKSRQFGCHMRLAQALAADGQLAAAAATVQQSLKGGSSSATVDQRFEAAFAGFWFAQLDLHDAGGSAIAGSTDPSGASSTIEAATESLYGLLMAEPHRGAREWRSLLDCIGLLKAPPRQAQIEACDEANSEMSPWSEGMGGFGFGRTMAQHWRGLLYLDVVLGSLLPDEFSPAAPSQGWRWATAASLRQISAGCMHISKAASAVDPSLVPPPLALANHTCIALLNATAARYRRRQRLQRLPRDKMLERYAGWPMSQLKHRAVEVERRENMSAMEFQLHFVAKSTPVIITDSSAFGLQLLGAKRTVSSTQNNTSSSDHHTTDHTGRDWLREHCGHSLVSPSEVIWQGDTLPDSERATALPTSSKKHKRQLKLGTLLKAGQKVTKSGAVGVGGWKIDNCPALRGAWRWPSVVSTRFGSNATTDASVWAWQEPRLFSAQGGTRSSLHTDIYASHHLTVVFEGVKLFRIFPPDVDRSAHLLYNDFSSRFEQEVDSVWDEPYGGWQVSHLGPGEMLYVPASCPHAVRNGKDGALSVGANYVDAHNWQRARLAAAMDAAATNKGPSGVGHVANEAMGVLQALSAHALHLESS